MQRFGSADESGESDPFGGDMARNNIPHLIYFPANLADTVLSMSSAIRGALIHLPHYESAPSHLFANCTFPYYVQ